MNFQQKEELIMDNNFGVSSTSRYANDSLWNGRSSSTTDCSLSPTSEYSPRPVCNDYNVLPFTPRSILDECRLDRSISDVVGLSNLDANIARDTLRCPMCTFSTSNRYTATLPIKRYPVVAVVTERQMFVHVFRLEFGDHLISRCALKRDDASSTTNILTQFPGRTIECLPGGCEEDSSPTLGERAERKMEKIDRSAIGDFTDWQDDVKKKQQQIKIFRDGKCCKQCSYVANTKLEYWEHMRGHIKGFTCPECSFVTKYKHHMNHHWLSVHDGTKPFKCKICLYTCVSKSMLTSHLKKHSNVYPYRCANCTYKTKFCNALKKHLRKKAHQPAVVLNADGSPNPLSIIDVYGTKRGPKQKLADKKLNNAFGQFEQNDFKIINDNRPTDSAKPVSSISSFESSVGAHYLAATTTETTNDDDAAGIDQTAMDQSADRPIVTFPYSDLMAAFNLSSHLLLREDLTRIREDHERGTTSDHAQRSDMLLEYTKRMNCNLSNFMLPDSFIQNLAVTCFDTTSDNGDEKSYMSDTTGESSAFVTTSKTPPEEHEDESTNVPLDLRKIEVIGKNHELHLELSIADLSKTNGTARRKDKALQLERRLVQNHEETPVNDAEFIDSATVDKLLAREEYGKVGKDVREKIMVRPMDNRLICHYCEIAFADAAMYGVHMSYHGFNDPYTCNICGDQCTDRLSFFLHIGRSKHA